MLVLKSGLKLSVQSIYLGLSGKLYYPKNWLGKYSLLYAWNLAFLKLIKR